MQNVAYLESEDIHPTKKLKSYVTQGKPVVLMAQGSHCGHCTIAKPAFENLSSQEKRVVFASIEIDGEPSERQAAKYITVWDPDFVGVPHYLGFDKGGKFVKVHKGGRDIRSLKTFAESLL